MIDLQAPGARRSPYTRFAACFTSVCNESNHWQRCSSASTSTKGEKSLSICITRSPAFSAISTAWIKPSLNNPASVIIRQYSCWSPVQLQKETKLQEKRHCNTKFHCNCKPPCFAEVISHVHYLVPFLPLEACRHITLIDSVSPSSPSLFIMR